MNSTGGTNEEEHPYGNSAVGVGRYNVAPNCTKLAIGGEGNFLNFEIFCHLDLRGILVFGGIAHAELHCGMGRKSLKMT